jgi:hypothetical protein
VLEEDIDGNIPSVQRYNAARIVPHLPEMSAVSATLRAKPPYRALPQNRRLPQKPRGLPQNHRTPPDCRCMDSENSDAKEPIKDRIFREIGKNVSICPKMNCGPNVKKNRRFLDIFLEVSNMFGKI